MHFICWKKPTWYFSILQYSSVMGPLGSYLSLTFFGNLIFFYCFPIDSVKFKMKNIYSTWNGHSYLDSLLRSFFLSLRQTSPQGTKHSWKVLFSVSWSSIKLCKLWYSKQKTLLSSLKVGSVLKPTVKRRSHGSKQHK